MNTPKTCWVGGVPTWPAPAPTRGRTQRDWNALRARLVQLWERLPEDEARTHLLALRRTLDALIRASST